MLTRHLFPLIVDGERILNVSSSLARMTLPGYRLYAATKGAEPPAHWLISPKLNFGQYWVCCTWRPLS